MTSARSEACPETVDRRYRGPQTRARILDAARTLFAAQGVAATTVEEITLTAGLSRATFYLHFTGKMSVVTELVAEQGESLLAFFAVLASDPEPSLARVKKWVRVFVGILRKNADMLNVIQLGTVSEPVREVLADHRRRVLAMLGERCPGFNCSGADHREQTMRFMRAVLFLNGLVGAIRVIALEIDPQERDAASEAVAAELLGKLREREPA